MSAQAEAKRQLVAIFKGGFVSAWSSASQEEKNAAVAHWVSLHGEWTKLGCRMLATLDDTYVRAGLPGGTRPWTFYEVWSVPDHEAVKAMLDTFRPENGTLRLDRYFRIEAIVGPPIPDLERAAGARE